MCVCIQFTDKQAGGHHSRGMGGRLGKVATVGLDEGCGSELQRRIIVSSCHVSCGDEEAKQLQSTHPHHPLALHPSSLPSALPLNIKGSL